MIKVDLHLHTFFSHGKMAPLEVHALAEKNGFTLIGFSEHSPRPKGYDYSNEYREKLETQLDEYVRQVLALKKNAATNRSACQVLFGMEMDWLPADRNFVTRACKSYNFDYLLGSVHFLDHWGFDDRKEDWENLAQAECDKLYEKYFNTWESMIKSGLFHIASHPDLIKIFSVEQFRNWVGKKQSVELLRKCLRELKNSGMAMEVSSAGLRKPCREIYPCPQIMSMAAELDVPIALASDTHAREDFMFGFNKLENYAKSFGYTRQAAFNHGKMDLFPF